MAISTANRLGELLVAEGFTTQETIALALKRTATTGEMLGDALIAMGAVKREDVLKALAVQLQLPYLFRGELPSPLPVVKNLSPKYLRQYTVCPVSVDNGILTVATADPLNPVIIDDLRQATGLEIRAGGEPARLHPGGHRSDLRRRDQSAPTPGGRR